METQKIPTYAVFMRTLLRNGGESVWIPTSTIVKETRMKVPNANNRGKEMNKNGFLLRKKEVSKRGGYICYWKANPNRLQQSKDTVKKYFGEVY